MAPYNQHLAAVQILAGSGRNHTTTVLRMTFESTVLDVIMCETLSQVFSTRRGTLEQFSTTAGVVFNDPCFLDFLHKVLLASISGWLNIHGVSENFKHTSAIAVPLGCWHFSEPEREKKQSAADRCYPHNEHRS